MLSTDMRGQRSPWKERNTCRKPLINCISCIKCVCVSPWKERNTCGNSLINSRIDCVSGEAGYTWRESYTCGKPCSNCE